MFSALPEQKPTDYAGVPTEHGGLIDVSALAPVFAIDYRVFFTPLVHACYVAVPPGVHETEGARIYHIFTP